MIPHIAQRQIELMPRWEELEAVLLADPETKVIYDSLEPEYVLLRQRIDRRLQKRAAKTRQAMSNIEWSGGLV